MKQEHEAMAPISRRYLDVQSAAIYLGSTPTAIYAAVARRQIPHRRLGRKLVFDKVELDMFVKALEGVSKDEAIARTMHGGTVKKLGR